MYIYFIAIQFHVSVIDHVGSSAGTVKCSLKCCVVEGRPTLRFALRSQELISLHPHRDRLLLQACRLLNQFVF